MKATPPLPHFSPTAVVLVLLAATFSTADTIAAPVTPAISVKQLSDYPRDGWLTNGGSLSNQRYSPLEPINRTNVAQLKARWRASLNGSGLNPRSGNQAQPIVYDGVIYISTGDGDAFAVDFDSGKVLWEFKANVDPKVAQQGYVIASAPLYYDGLVITGFAGSDMGTRGRVKAYDAKTGDLRWTFYTVPAPTGATTCRRSARHSSPTSYRT